MIYLDYAASTPAAPEAIEAVCSCMREIAGNPSAPHAAGNAARRILTEARKEIAACLGADASEIVFTSGGSESNTMAVRSCAGEHAVISAIEHPSVTRAASKAFDSVSTVRPDSRGIVNPDRIEAEIRPDTRLIAVQAVNNETGVIQPFEEIARIARRHRIPFLCDAVQAFGHIPLSVQKTPVSYLTFSAHKFYGPRGVGFIYIRTGAPASPLVFGGGQENHLRAGTENIPGIAGMRAAVRGVLRDMESRHTRETRQMEAFTQSLEEAGIRRLGNGAPRTGNIGAFLLPSMSAEAAAAKLDLMGICVSTGSACANGDPHAGETYRSMGLSMEESRRVLRISIGRGNEDTDLEIAARAILELCAGS